MSELLDGELSPVQYPIKTHFLSLIRSQGSRIFCASCVPPTCLMIYPDMMHNRFKGKQGFLSLSPETSRAILIRLNLIKWLQQRQCGGQLLPAVVDVTEERQLLKSHLPLCTCRWFQVSVCSRGTILSQLLCHDVKIWCIYSLLRIRILGVWTFITNVLLCPGTPPRLLPQLLWHAEIHGTLLVWAWFGAILATQSSDSGCSL